jgi:excisionase family DNA binding protein
MDPTTNLDDLPAILTTEEAAALMRVTEQTIKKWCRAGKMPGAFKLGGREWRVSRDVLVAHIRGQREPS